MQTSTSLSTGIRAIIADSAHGFKRRFSRFFCPLRHTGKAKRQFQRMLLEQRPVAQDLPRRPIGRDLPVVQQQDAVARLEHKVEIVRCDDLRHRQRIERADERAAVFRVKRRGRLVHEHDLRLHGEDVAMAAMRFSPPESLWLRRFFRCVRFSSASV